MPDIFSFSFWWWWWGWGWGGRWRLSATLLSLASRRTQAEGVCGLERRMKAAFVAGKQAEFHPEGVALVAVTSAWAFLKATALGLTCAPANSPESLGPLLASLGLNSGLFSCPLNPKLTYVAFMKRFSVVLLLFFVLPLQSCLLKVLCVHTHTYTNNCALS